MPTIGSIVEDGKLLVPVYVEGEGSSSTGPIIDEEGKIIYSPATVAAVGGFYNSTLYALIVDQGGNISSVTWDRTNDPVITSTQTQLPPTSIPNASGFLITVDPILSGVGDAQYIDNPSILADKTNHNTIYNQINIYEYGDNPPTTGRYTMDQKSFITGCYNHYNSYYYCSPVNFQINNNTSKNLEIQINGEYTTGKAINLIDYFSSSTWYYADPPYPISNVLTIPSNSNSQFSLINTLAKNNNGSNDNTGDEYQLAPSSNFYRWVNWEVQFEFVIIVNE